MDDTSMGDTDICRVCRCEGTAEKPLFHPCICTGSIKFIHQDCLVQWLKYSEKEYCELCNYRFSFIPIYSPDMPTSLPLRDVVHGLLTSLATASRFWLQLTLVAIAWLGIVPLTAFRIYKCLFSGSASAIFSLPLDLLSPDHLVSDAFYGCCVVTCTLCSFISLVWLREQILRAGPDWLLVQPQPVVPPGDAAAAAAAAAPAEPAPQDLNDPDAAAPDQLLDHEQDQAHPDHWPDDGLAPGPAVDADPGQLAAAAVGPNDPVDNNNAEADINAPAAAAAAPAAAAGGAGGPWDRAADELTWERILGLDGSLVFLEHVLWVICLNTLFILIFAFLPFHIGNQIVSRVQCLKDAATASQFVGLVTTVFGYFVIGLFLVVMHGVTCLFHLRRSQQILGLCYVTVKVSLLSVFELGVFPLVCGVWLDICSLPMLGSRLEDRQESFRSAPGTSLFIHWLVGMIYVFYFASFILLLREVVRPGVLWFLQNLNDPDFNPIQEMIHLPIIGHARRFLASLVIFGSTVLLLIWFPVLIVQRLIPGLLPFHVSIYAPPSASSSAAATNTSPAVGTSSPDGLLIADSASSQIVLSPTVAVSVSSPESSPVGELSLEFLLLQLVLPALLDHGHLRQWLKSAIRNWCVIVSSILGIRSYLLGDVVLTDAPHAEVIVRREDQENEELAILEDEEEDEVEEEEEEDSQNQPYLVPSLFPFRILCLLVFVAASVLLSGVLLMSVPVMTGRKLIALWMGDGVRVHELNTAACGLYVGLLVMRLLQLLAAWIPRGLEAILSKVREGLVILSKTAIAGVVLLGLIPLLIGILFDVVIIVPLRVPVNQSPIFYLWQDWAFGVLHTKVICGIAMLGPADLRLRDLLEQMYRAGLVHMDLRMILLKLALPVVTILGLALALPYVLVSSLVPILVSSSSPEQLLESQSLILRRVYPFLLFASVLIFLVTWHVRKYWRLLEHIKNDKYLVGKRLVNYDPKAGSKAKKAAAAAAAATHAAGPANPALQPQQQQQQQVLNDPPLEPPVEPPVLVD